MSNDEKILAILETLVMKVDRLEAGQAKLEAGQLQTNQRLDRLENDVSGIKILIENEIRPNIGIIAEGHLALNQKLDHLKDLDEKMEDLQIRVFAIEEVTKNNLEDIKELKRAAG
ncbi:MAG: hypothetical protein LBS62_04595 [Clostridiales bacterium]|jgi:hypothetical protein|nr:hypothetical protein [Clostridiales bacterium]